MRRLAASLAVAWLAVSGNPAHAETPVIYATQPGMPALDLDPWGGNPFASAVIAALRDPATSLEDALASQTAINSRALQFPDFSDAGSDPRLLPAAGERAAALVIVFADYGDEAGLVSLPGAAFDAHRVSAALAQGGYEVQTLIARDAAGYLAGLDEFALKADAADRSLVYTTGHGVEVDGTIYLIPPDAEVADNVLAASLRLPNIRKRFDGPGARLLIFAGCRDNPMELVAPARASQIREP